MRARIIPQGLSVVRRPSSVSPHRRQAESGFTLLELLIVVALIIVLAGLMIPAFFKVKNAANERKAQIEVRVIGSAIQAYKLQKREFPAPSGDLGGGKDLTYGEGDRDNGEVMALLRDAIPPVLDKNKLQWEGDNVIDPYGDQYKITLDLDYNGSAGGAKADYKVE